MSYSFFAPTMIVQKGAAKEIGKQCAEHMSKACIFRYGQHFFDSGTYDVIKKTLDEHGVEHAVFDHVQGEPSPQVINDAAKFMQENNCDGGLAIGGGSVIDACKATCALAPNGSDIMDYVEGFSPIPFEKTPYPMIAMPTTAGTGSECSKNAVITLKGHFKNSVRDDSMVPKYAVLDAEIMLDVPKDVTAASGADCICQLIEGYTSGHANPLTDALTFGFIRPAFEALPVAYKDGSNVQARETMAISASASGIGLANGGLGAAHGLASGLGALTELTHGIICGVTLPHVMRLNISKGVVDKYADIAEELTDESFENKEQAALWAATLVEQLNERLDIPRNFKRYSIDKKLIPDIAAASMGSSMSKNPVKVTLEECKGLLEELL